MAHELANRLLTSKNKQQMKKYLLKTSQIIAVFTLLIAIGCTPAPEKKQAISESNILLQEWTGPYGGVPAFDKMQLTDLKLALELAIEENLAEIQTIVNKEAVGGSHAARESRTVDTAATSRTSFASSTIKFTPLYLSQYLQLTFE